MPNNARIRPIYSNILQIAADGTKLATIDKKRALWYQKRGLGEYNEAEPDENSGYSGYLYLNFNPKEIKQGITKYDIMPHYSRCSVCGISNPENGKKILNLHHVTPRVIRVNFPVEKKEHNRTWLVPTCVKCHEKIEASYSETHYWKFMERTERFIKWLRASIYKLWIWKHGGPNGVNLMFKDIFMQTKPKFVPPGFLENR